MNARSKFAHALPTALLLGALAMGVSMAAGFAARTAAMSTADAKAAAQSYTEKTLAPFLNELTVLKDELKAANAARKDWKAFSEDWKKWTPEEAEKNKPGYGYSEYLWSGKKDKAFRAEHTGTKAAEALKAFQDKSGGAVAEFFVTDAKGGNVAQTQVTSDWFQGDEEKFTKVEGKKEVFFAEPKRDDTVGQTGVQVSVPLWDKDTFLGFACVTVITEKAK